ncbi:MAG: PLP-dependent aminotransferase family protein, partial [Chitinophagales bacterium]
MLPFKTLIVINSTMVTAVYQQIADQLIGIIRDGLLKPGASLPSSREMALLLHVHRKTVVSAYEELESQDWIETLPRKGVRVLVQLPETKPRTFKAVAKVSGYAGKTGFTYREVHLPASQSFRAAGHRLIINDGFPDARIAPVDLLMKEYRTLSSRQSMQRITMFGNATGSVNLRRALAKFLSETRGLNIGENNILMTHGAQMAIHIAANMILKRDSTVVVGEPNYFMANEIFKQCGAKLIQVPVDENGIDVNQLEKICRRKKPDLLYIIPHHHHPTTVTLSADRRIKLLQLINSYNLPVIEDDYDYDF